MEQAVDEKPDHHFHWRPTWIGSDRRLARVVARPISRFLQIEAASGILLLVATAVALVWANSAWSASYESFWSTSLTIELGGLHLDESLKDWVNDGLMAVFFFVAGIEIKRELVSGELRDPKAAALPIIGALGGMLVPGAIFFALNAGGPGEGGWGIPMATDIAFAVGVVALMGHRVPASLKLFLLTLAIVDDLGGILVIAVFYATDLSFAWLAVAFAAFASIVALRRAHVWYLPVYAAIGVLSWYAMLESGVHAAIAGVVLGVLTPATALRSQADAAAIAHSLDRPDVTADDVRRASFLIQETVPVGERLSNLLHPWSGYVIIPIFALANAGIPLSSEAISAAASSSVTYGAALGLVVGKTVGIFVFTWVGVRLGLAVFPPGVRRLNMLAISATAGVGFTVALFVTDIAFADPALQDEAKVGILVASAVAALAGSGLSWLAWKRSSVIENPGDGGDVDDLADAEEGRPLQDFLPAR